MAKSTDVFDHAKRGDAEFFKTVAFDVLQGARDEHDESALTRAARENHLKCCEEICKRCPSLIYHQNKYGNTPVQWAALRGWSIIVGFLTRVGTEKEKEVAGKDKVHKKLLTIRNNFGETALFVAVKFQRLETVRVLIEADVDQEALKVVDNNHDTPLHIAVRNQNFEIVKLFTGREPDFDYGGNYSFHTPLMDAFQVAMTYGNSDDNNTAVKIKKLLLEKQPRQCKVRIGVYKWTLLHCSALEGYLSGIDDIIRCCPDCLEVVDNNGANFFHIVAKFDHVKVVKHILGMKDIPVSVLNGQDKDGNTPLHTAVLNGNASTALCLLYDRRVDKMTANAKGQRVLDAIDFPYDKIKAGVHGIRDSVNEKELKDQSDFDLLVCALIAAVSFTAGIIVPGGYTSQGKTKGMAVLSKNLSFEVCVLSNNFALMLSLYAVFSHFCTRRLLKQEDILYQLNVATFCTLGAIFAMMVAFITGSYAVLAVSNELAIAGCVNCCCFFIFAFRAKWRMIMQYWRPTS